MSARLKFGLLGTGPWAQRTHGPALAAHKDVELTGVWGRRSEAARELAGTLGTRAYDDVDALLTDCDAVAVALPPDVQAPLAVRAAEAGCHLLLDKPVATEPEAARRVTEAATAAGVASVVFFTLRFSEPTASWIAEQAAVEGWLTGRADWFSPVFGGADSPYTASPWRRERGALWDVGPHALSVLLPVLGDVAAEGTAAGEAAARGSSAGAPEAGDPAAGGGEAGGGEAGGGDAVDTAAAAPARIAVRAARGHGDTVHLLLWHEGGASSTCSLSHSMPPAASGVTAEVRGPAGTAALPGRDEAPADAFARAVDALLAAAGGGAAHPCDVRFAQRVTEILAAAEQAL